MSRPDPERLAVWRGLHEAHSTIVALLEAELRSERELPLGWYEVLTNLHEAGGVLRMHELAARLVANRSSLTRLVDRLEAAGLVERQLCDDDGRGVEAVLTREGRDELRRCSPTHLRGINEHFAQYLTDSDVIALQRVLAKLPSPDQPV